MESAIPQVDFDNLEPGQSYAVWDVATGKIIDAFVVVQMVSRPSDHAGLVYLVIKSGRDAEDVRPPQPNRGRYLFLDGYRCEQYSPDQLLAMLPHVPRVQVG